MPTRGLFVTATDTGVGKTVLSSALLGAMAAAGERVLAHKPVLTGLEEQPAIGALPHLAERWPSDDVLLARAAGMHRQDVAPLRYGPAVSPHLAAEIAGERIDPARLLANARAAGARASSAGGVLVVEGVGGLLAPLAERFAVRDLAAALGLPLLIAARPGLGTINHTLLTLQSARAAGLDVRAVVLTPWPHEPSRMERSNRETIASLGRVPVEVLARIPAADAADLARAGASLPWRLWLDGPQPAVAASAAATTACVTFASSSSSIT